MNSSTFKCFVSLIKQDLVWVRYCVSLLLAMVWLLISFAVVFVLVGKTINPYYASSNFFTGNAGYILTANLVVAIVTWFWYRVRQAINNNQK